MKRYLLIMLALAMVCTFFACGTGDTATSTQGVETTTVPVETSVSPEMTEAEQTDDPALTLTVTINPKFKLHMDEEGIVCLLDAMNEDARSFAEQISIENADYVEVIRRIIREAHKKGFIKDDAEISFELEDVKGVGIDKEAFLNKAHQAVKEMEEELGFHFKGHEASQPEMTEPETEPAQTVPTKPSASKPAHQHNYSKATCTSPARCSCGKTSGKALGHSWTAATCTSAKKCATCDTAEGKALGHSWTEATCITPKKCATCGTTEGEALGHSYVDGTCACGETNYLDPRTVDLLETQWFGKYYEWILDDEEDIAAHELRIPTILFRDHGDGGDFKGIGDVEIGDEFYLTEPVSEESLPYREYLSYTIYNGEKWNCHGVGVGLGYYFELTEKEILIYSYWQEDELPGMKLMVMKDGTMVCTGGVATGHFEIAGFWEDLGPMSTDKDAICGLEIVQEKNPDYIEDTET